VPAPARTSAPLRSPAAARPSWAQFTFGGRAYLAINQDATRNAFDDTGDLLLDITGVTGTIGSGDFTV
jgi:hypothetical protein